MAAERRRQFPATAERYGGAPLPAARYLPGRMPRPVDPEVPELPERFRYGVDLYNNGYWWEAHAAWEDVWLRLPPNSAKRHGVQAMIQVANCHLKIHLGQVKAARALARDLERLFDAALLHTPDLVVEGLALAPWRDRVDGYFGVVLEEREPSFDAGRYPSIALRAGKGKGAGGVRRRRRRLRW